MSKKLVLIVDDSSENISLLRSMLIKNGFIPTAAKTADEAVYMTGMHRFSVIIVNLSIDGFETIKTLRPASNVPIIAMAPRAYKGDFEAAEFVGANGHIGKPVDEDELIALIKKWESLPAEVATN